MFCCTLGNMRAKACRHIATLSLCSPNVNAVQTGTFIMGMASTTSLRTIHLSSTCPFIAMTGAAVTAWRLLVSRSCAVGQLSTCTTLSMSMIMLSLRWCFPTLHIAATPTLQLHVLEEQVLKQLM